MTHSPSLVLIQKLESHCARCVQPFRINGRLHMAIAQFAKDVGGEMPGMHAGDSDVPVLLYRWEQGAFVYEGEVPATGGEDAEYFEISGRRFLAVANIRSGSRPYEHDVTSMIYEHRDGNWYSFQVVASFGAKQWRHFVIEGEHFLGLAQGIQVPELSTQHPSTSRIYRWNGCSFVEFQVIDGHWGYNWSHVKHAGRHFLAYADHTSFSPVFEWKDGRFQPWLKMAEKGGRAFCFFEESGSLLGVFASISGRTLLGTFSDQGFHCIQELGGTGGRELALLEHDGQRY